MTANPMRKFLDILRGTVLLQENEDQSDGQLLKRFVECRDNLALETLVRRHAPMVWSVCRRNLARQDDAEDAFQATFLVFLRKAASIRGRELLANWLYGVACQTCRKARQTAAKRPVPLPTPEPPMVTPDDAFGPELRSKLDRELSRLPEKYRSAIVLCHLEGKSLRDAAQQMRVAEGTIGSRLSRGREMLARRLARPGVNVPAIAVAAVLTEQAASAAEPGALLGSLIQAVGQMAAGQAAAGPIPPKVAALAEGVLKTIFLKKLKAAMLIFALVTGLLAASGVLLGTLADEKPPIEENRAEIPDPTKRGDKALASYIVVSTSYPRVRPHYVAQIIAPHIEEPIRGMEGLVRIESESTLGTYRGRFYFAPGTDLTAAEKEVKQRVINGLVRLESADDGKFGLPPDLPPKSVIREGVSVNFGAANENPKNVTIAVIDRKVHRVEGVGWEALDKAAADVVKRLEADGGVANVQAYPRVEKSVLSVDSHLCSVFAVPTEDVLKVLESALAKENLTIKVLSRGVPIEDIPIKTESGLLIRDIGRVGRPPAPGGQVGLDVIEVAHKSRSHHDLTDLLRKVIVKENTTLGDLVRTDFQEPASVFRLDHYPAVRITGSPANGESAPKLADRWVEFAKDALRDSKDFTVQNLTSK
jgi:RNA polymerase sigma factor (sigma-70 family)